MVSVLLYLVLVAVTVTSIIYLTRIKSEFQNYKLKTDSRIKQLENSNNGVDRSSNENNAMHKQLSTLKTNITDFKGKYNQLDAYYRKRFSNITKSLLGILEQNSNFKNELTNQTSKLQNIFNNFLNATSIKNFIKSQVKDTIILVNKHEQQIRNLTSFVQFIQEEIDDVSKDSTVSPPPL